VTYWSPGTQIMWCYGEPGLEFAAPMTVVRDDARGLVAWLPVGTTVLKLVRFDGRPLRAEPSESFVVARRQVSAVWEDHSVLRIAVPGRSWSVWLFFSGETGAFQGWYVNIEDPHVREGRTTRSLDHVLDLWVEPDRSVERKDEDELVLAVEQGRYTQAEAAAFTAVADEVELVVGAWGSPFCDGWESFEPDPDWTGPTLPPPS
jgi:hypothetical protein